MRNLQVALLLNQKEVLCGIPLLLQLSAWEREELIACIPPFPWLSLPVKSFSPSFF